MSVVAIEPAAWEGILQVQDEAYQDLESEALHVLQSKWQASPDTCFVYRSSRQDVLGYLLAHPWQGEQPPKLYQALSPVTGTDTLYLHDMAVSASAQGEGVGRKLSSALLQVAKASGFSRIMLVAVQGAHTYWQKMGFEEVHNASLCDSYGDSARLMTLQLAS
ncbi:GNAT family N-acetyltransferase [Pokkaliibacter sp. CJK22405]|uniref:GNAT family N-acetyltransferase n=1 Tax=Pokkaliibacter sp. CJK22405 TaxID=3384615 RepID=UPI0039847CA6